MRDNPSNIKVLFVESGVTGGGSFESLYQHLRAIDRKTITPIVVFLNETRYLKKVERLGIQTHLLNDRMYSLASNNVLRTIWQALAWRIDRYLPNQYLSFVRFAQAPLIKRLVSIIRQERIDIIHLNVQVNRDLFGIVAAKITGTKCISHLRSVHLSGGFAQHRAEFTNQIVSAYIANLSYTYDFWKSKKLLPEKMELVHNGISMQETVTLECDSRKEFDISNEEFTVGCVARLDPVKGHEFLLNAFSKVLDELLAKLLIIGDGPEKQSLVDLAQALNIEDHVIFCGMRTDTISLIAQLDVSVSVSVWDSFGRTVLETMMAKTPLIATNVGSISDIAIHEENALLVEYGNDQSFVDAVIKLRNSPQLRNHLTTNAFCAVHDKFSIERYAEKIQNIYQDALQTPHAAS